MVKQLFDLGYGMFEGKNNNTVHWFMSESYEMPVKYELVGILLGLAMYN